MKQDYEYYAFISYSWNDKKWAKWLQRKLESYRLPSIVRKQYPDIPKKLKIFRDGTDIRIGTSLQQILHEELEKSKYLIVVCSPHSAQSDWVGKEIEEFIAMGRKNQIFLFIIDGTPYCDLLDNECYHPIIKQHFPEILGANIHEQKRGNIFIKRDKAFLRLIAGMLNLSFDILWNRHRRYFIRKILLCILSLIGFITIFNWVWFSNKPFDVKITMYETTANNPKLPFENGTISLVIENDTITRSINQYAEVASFNQIAGKFYNKKTHIIFNMYGYNTTNIEMRLTSKIQIPIHRDNSFGKIKGYVRERATDRYLSKVSVKIANEETQTDESGYFELYIPLYSQRIKYHAVLEQEGKIIKINEDIYPTLNDAIRINTLYVE